MRVRWNRKKQAPTLRPKTAEEKVAFTSRMYQDLIRTDISQCPTDYQTEYRSMTEWVGTLTVVNRRRAEHHYVSDADYETMEGNWKTQFKRVTWLAYAYSPEFARRIVMRQR
jgi:hypothetical protein